MNVFWIKRCILLITHVMHSIVLNAFESITSMPFLWRSWLITSILQWFNRRCQIHAIAFCWLRNCIEFANERLIDWNCIELYSIIANSCLSRMSQTFSSMILIWRIFLCIFHINLFFLSLLIEINVIFEIKIYVIFGKNNFFI